MNDDQLILQTLAFVGAVLLLLTTIQVAIPSSKKVLPIGGSDFNQTAAAFLLAISLTTIWSLAAPMTADACSGTTESLALTPGDFAPG